MRKQHAAHLTYPARYKPRLGKRPNPNRNVETSFDQIKIAIREHELDPHARMRVKKARHDRYYVPAAEEGWCGDP
jgi:hypothetical protein